MKFPLIFLATLVAATSAREFYCNHNNVGVCCTNHGDEFERCHSAERRNDNQNPPPDQNQPPPQNQDPNHNQGPDHDKKHPPRQDRSNQDEYFCADNEFQKCCDDHDDINLNDKNAPTRRNCHDG